ncbi:hypothetical protein A2U01_0109727, partial [Trifolium medium]|nr:hypothetical protein [Trifolium medium]
MMNDKRGRGEDRGKPYDNKGKKIAGNNSGKDKKNGNGRCYKCGAPGHRFFE